MNHEEPSPRRYQISSAAEVPLVVVEAIDEAQALERAVTVSHVARLPVDPRGLYEWNIDELHPAQIATVPLYCDNYFQLLDADRTGRH